MKPLRVLTAARHDIESERRYYNRAQAGLGSSFARAVARALRNISLNPEAMQVIDKGMRRWPVEHFPHGVMYFIGETEILVISVFHPLQHPSRWKRRT